MPQHQNSPILFPYTVCTVCYVCDLPSWQINFVIFTTVDNNWQMSVFCSDSIAVLGQLKNSDIDIDIK